MVINPEGKDYELHSADLTLATEAAPIIKEATDAGHTETEVNEAFREGEEVGAAEVVEKSPEEVEAKIAEIEAELKPITRAEAEKIAKGITDSTPEMRLRVANEFPELKSFMDEEPPDKGI